MVKFVGDEEWEGGRGEEHVVGDPTQASLTQLVDAPFRSRFEGKGGPLPSAVFGTLCFIFFVPSLLPAWIRKHEHRRSNPEIF